MEKYRSDLDKSVAKQLHTNLKMDELSNIGDDRSFLSLKVIFCQALGSQRKAT